MAIHSIKTPFRASNHLLYVLSKYRFLKKASIWLFRSLKHLKAYYLLTIISYSVPKVKLL